MEGMFLSVILAITTLLLFMRIFTVLWRGKKEVVFKKITQDIGTSQNGLGRADYGSRVNVLVVGGQGLLGNKLVHGLTQDGGYIVHSLDLYIPSENNRIPGVRSYIQTDITRREDVVKAIKGMETVFITASLQPSLQVSNETMEKVNIGGVRNVIEACKMQGVKRLIYTSSVSVTMPKNPDPPHDLIVESQPFPDEPLNMYVKSKGTAELMVRGATGTNGLNTVALRMAGLMGGRKNSTVTNMMWPLLFYPGDGNFKIDYVDIDSAVRAHMIAEKKLCKEQLEESLRKGLSSNGIHENGTGHKSLSTTISGKAYNITMREKCSLKEVAEFVSEIRGVPRPIRIPYFILTLVARINRWMYIITGLALFPFTEMLIDFLRPFNFLPDLANKELGWVDETSWKDIVRKAIREYNQ